MKILQSSRVSEVHGKMANDLNSDDNVLVQNINEYKGRGLFALRDFRKGETLFREKPIVSCQFSWNRVYGYKCCHHCLEPLETANENVVRLANDPNIVLPNHECCSTRQSFHCKCPHCDCWFCSKSCQEEAWNSYHKVLCHNDPNHPLAILDEIWRPMHYPPETSSIGLVIRILATIVQAPDPEEQIGILMSLMHDTVNKKEQLAHKMLGERFADQLEQLRMACTTAFASYPVVQSFLSPDGFAAIFALIGRNSQGIGTSSFAVWTKKVEKLATKPNEKSQLEKLIDTVYDAIEQNAGSFLNNEGSGLYAKQSTINHSCDPNAEVEFPFNNHELVVNASKNISAGEEILISYLECCDLERSRHSRSKMLSENYLFLCDCMKCQSQMGDPDVTSDEEMSSEEASEDDDE